MRFLRLTAVFWVLAFALAFAVDRVSLAELAKSPKNFDGKTISVTGTVSDVKQKTSRKGNKYFTFVLKEGAKYPVNVYAQGEADPALKDEAKVTAIGVYRQEKKILDFTVKNEIDASKVEGKENGIKILK